MSEINEKPESIYKAIKNLLSIAVKDRRNPYHTPVFSNISNSIQTESRIVVLRKFDEKNLILNFHTDYRSPKIQDLEKNKNSSFLFYNPIIKIQIRIKTISTIHNQDIISKESWELTNLSSRKCYLAQKKPSSETFKPEDGIPNHLNGVDPSKDESERGYKNFVVIQNKIEKIDWLHLAFTGHRRLNIICKNNILSFNWLIP